MRSTITQFCEVVRSFGSLRPLLYLASTAVCSGILFPFWDGMWECLLKPISYPQSLLVPGYVQIFDLPVYSVPFPNISVLNLLPRLNLYSQSLDNAPQKVYLIFDFAPTF